jgi:hypothetical protein
MEMCKEELFPRVFFIKLLFHRLMWNQRVPFEYSNFVVSAFQPDFSIVDYASILLEINKEQYYFIHGGFSETFSTVYSSAFVIDFNNQYFEVLEARNGPA